MKTENGWWVVQYIQAIGPIVITAFGALYVWWTESNHKKRDHQLNNIGLAIYHRKVDEWTESFTLINTRRVIFDAQYLKLFSYKTPFKFSPTKDAPLFVRGAVLDPVLKFGRGNTEREKPVPPMGRATLDESEFKLVGDK